MVMWIDKVSIECSKCKDTERFDILLNVSDFASEDDIIEAICDNYAEGENDTFDMAEKGKIHLTSNGPVFTCRKCLKKIMKAKKIKFLADKNKKKKGNLTEHIVGKRIK